MTPRDLETRNHGQFLSPFQSSSEGASLAISITNDVIPDSTLDGWIFFLRELPQAPITEDRALTSNSPRCRLLLATLLARRYLIRHDKGDYDEAQSLGETAMYQQDEDGIDMICQYLEKMTQASQLRELLDSDSTVVPMASSPTEIPPSAINLGSTESSDPARLLQTITFIRQNIHDSVDLEEYARACFTLARTHYSLFRHSNDRLDLKEAFEYSATASFLFSGLGLLLILQDSAEWSMIKEVFANYVDCGLLDINPDARGWDISELYDLHHSAVAELDIDMPDALIASRSSHAFKTEDFLGQTPTRSLSHTTRLSSPTFSHILNDLLDSFPWKYMSTASQDPHGVSSTASGDTLLFLVKSVQETLHLSADLEDYVQGCLTLAYSHYILYHQSGDRHNFDEAFEYSFTTCFLLVELGRPLSGFADCPEWKVAYGVSRNYMIHFFQDFTSLTRTWKIFELYELFRSTITGIGAFQVDPLPEFLHWYKSGHHLVTISTYLSAAAQPGIEKQLDLIKHRLMTEQPVPLADYAVVHGIVSLLNSRRLSTSDVRDTIGACRKVMESGGVSESVLALEILARIHTLRCTFFGWDERAGEDARHAEKYFREAIASSPDPVESALLIIHFVDIFWIPRLTGNGSGGHEGLIAVLDSLHAAADSIGGTNHLFPDVALALAQTHRLNLVHRTGQREKHFTQAVFWYQKYADVAGPRAGLERRVQSLKRSNGTRSHHLGWYLPLYIGLLHTINWARGELQKNHPECLDGFNILSSFTDDPIWMGNSLEAKQLPLRTIRSIGPSAVAAVLRFDTGHPHIAVEYLERSLSITYRQLLQLKQRRGNLPGLAGLYPKLAEKLERLSIGLRHLSSETAMPAESSSLPVKVDIFKQGAEYKELANKIRTKAGFEDLFLPPSYTKLAAASKAGPVIMLSSDDVTKATYALIILCPDEEPIPLFLSEAAYDDIRKHTAALARLLERCNVLQRQPEAVDGRAGRPSKWPAKSRSSGFDAILQWLWTMIVQPIFEALATKGVNSGRVWWCPAGDLIHLPIHAAAPIDCPYISSYTYTLEVLINARAQMQALSETGSLRMSVVGLSTYPGNSRLSLPSVKAETKALYHIAKAINQTQDRFVVEIAKIEDAKARVGVVLAAMKSSQIIHLACHGFQDRSQPLDSHLILSDGILQLRKVLSEELSVAKFAFLSACQTATGDIELANESIHLAGGFMAAGLKGVVGTLWSIADEDAPRVAREVYNTILTEDGLDITKAAEGLHNAVRRMRKDDLPPHRWIPFIHVGV